MSDDLHVDGNGVAGVLQQVLAVEVTTLRRRCQSCGSTHEVGAHPAFEGAGAVLRCPSCGDVAARVVRTRDAHVVELRGAWSFPDPSA